MNTPATQTFQQLAQLLATTRITGPGSNALDLDSGVGQVVRSLLEIRQAGTKVMIVGNGGSASIAGHVQLDLCNRASLRALAFADAPILTALSNDHGYAHCFERQVQLWADRGDCLIAISSSGKSENILRAVQAARVAGCSVFTLSGFSSDNPLRGAGDLNFFVDSAEYGPVEVAHQAIAHFVCDCVVEQAASQDALSRRAAG